MQLVSLSLRAIMFLLNRRFEWSSLVQGVCRIIDCLYYYIENWVSLNSLIFNQEDIEKWSYFAYTIYDGSSFFAYTKMGRDQWGYEMFGNQENERNLFEVLPYCHWLYLFRLQWLNVKHCRIQKNDLLFVIECCHVMHTCHCKTSSYNRVFFLNFWTK